MFFFIKFVAYLLLCVFTHLLHSSFWWVNFRSPLEKDDFSTAPPNCKWNRLITPDTESKSFQVCYQTVRQDNADKCPKFQNCVWTFYVSIHRVYDQTSKIQVCHACTSFESEIVYCCIRIDCRDSNTISSLGQRWMVDSAEIISRVAAWWRWPY